MSYEDFAPRRARHRRGVAAGRPAEGRPRRHRHAQSAGMAGGVLWLSCSPAASRLCSTPGGPARSCNMGSTIPAPRSRSSIASGSSGLFEHLHNCPALERVFVSRENEEVAHPNVTKLESVVGDVNSWQPVAGPAAAGRGARSGGRRDDPLHVGHDRQAERRARHPSQFHARRSWRGRFGMARGFMRRGEPVPRARSERAAEGSLLVVPLVPRHRLPRAR